MKTAHSIGAFLSVLVSGCLVWCTGCGTPDVPKPPPPPPATSKPASATSLPVTGSPSPGVSTSPVAQASARPFKATGTPVAVSGGTVSVSLSDKGPDPQSFAVSADKEITIKVINRGTKAYGFKFEGDFGRRVSELKPLAPGKEGELVMNFGPGSYTASQIAEDETALPSKAVTFESTGTAAAAPPASPGSPASPPPSSPKAGPASPKAPGSPAAKPASPGTP